MTDCPKSSKKGTHKVLIVDDSPLNRRIVKNIITEHALGKIIGEADNGRIALDILSRQHVDLVFLDLYMPELNGFDTLKIIKEKYPNTKVVIVSGASALDANVTVKCLEMGAFDFIPKPTHKSWTDNLNYFTAHLNKVFLALQSINSSFPSSSACEPQSPLPPVNLPSELPRKIDIIAIGASTGGPCALADFIPKLQPNVNCPILIVQHMPPLFTHCLAERLDQASPFSVKEAQHGDVVHPNSIYIAPGGKHMIMLESRSNSDFLISITDSQPVNYSKPSVDILFSSIAKIPHLSVLSIVLTGMGNDGAQGVRELKKNSCYSIVQDEESSIVFSMPRNVIDLGVADEILPLKDMPDRVSNILKPACVKS